MGKERRRGNWEVRKPKAIKTAVATSISPFALKTPSVAMSAPKQKR